MADFGLKPADICMVAMAVTCSTTGHCQATQHCCRLCFLAAYMHLQSQLVGSCGRKYNALQAVSALEDAQHVAAQAQAEAEGLRVALESARARHFEQLSK